MTPPSLPAKLLTRKLPPLFQQVPLLTEFLFLTVKVGKRLQSKVASEPCFQGLLPLGPSFFPPSPLRGEGPGRWPGRHLQSPWALAKGRRQSGLSGGVAPRLTYCLSGGSSVAT